MGMSTYVTALRNKKSKEYEKHANVLKACIEADIEKLPKETAKYFNSDYPCKSLFEEKLELNINYTDFSDDGISGIEVKVSDIPKSCHVLRFSNSW
jgi:hypothetical protein